MVDIFRASQHALPSSRKRSTLNPKPQVIWMQLGVRNDEAAAKAEAAGIKVVMNRCPKIEYGRLSSEISWIGVNSRTLSSKRAPLLGKGVQRMSLNRQTMSGGTTDATDRAERDKKRQIKRVSENRTPVSARSRILQGSAFSSRIPISPACTRLVRCDEPASLRKPNGRQPRVQP